MRPVYKRYMSLWYTRASSWEARIPRPSGELPMKTEKLTHAARVLKIRELFETRQFC